MFVNRASCTISVQWCDCLLTFGTALFTLHYLRWCTLCRLRGCKNWPAPFPGRMSYKATKPGLALSYILACFIVLLFIRAPFYVLLVFVAMCSVFRLFWLSYHYLPSDWLERLLWGSLIVVRGSSRPKSAHDFLGLLYCFIVLLCMYVVSCPYVIYYPTVMARYIIACLCWKCR